MKGDTKINSWSNAQLCSKKLTVIHLPFRLYSKTFSTYIFASHNWNDLTHAENGRQTGMILINPQKTFGAFDHKILLGKKKCNKVFSAEGMGEVPPLLAKNLLILAPSGKVRTVDSPPKFLSPHQKFILLTKYNFSCYNPIKTSFLAVVIAPVLFLSYLHTLCTHRSCYYWF